MFSFLNRFFRRKTQNQWGESLPTKLLRDGWIPHRFPNSTVAVLLPPGVTASFDNEGVLYGFTTGPEPIFSATLHSGPEFTESRNLALEFVEHLAQKKGARTVDVATYRYFIDPTEEQEGSRTIMFCVIGIPGAAVVISLSRQLDSPSCEHFDIIRTAIPQIVGELL